MFGWSIHASACRSCSKRATTWRVSMPSLMILSATVRRTGTSCSARKTEPNPPSPRSFFSVYGPTREPGPSTSESTESGTAPLDEDGGRLPAAPLGAGSSRPLPALRSAVQSAANSSGDPTTRGYRIDGSRPPDHPSPAHKSEASNPVPRRSPPQRGRSPVPLRAGNHWNFHPNPGIGPGPRVFSARVGRRRRAASARGGHVCGASRRRLVRWGWT